MNFAYIFVFQEVYLLYTHGEVFHDTFLMKLFQPMLISLQIAELSSYMILFRAVSKHDENMKQNKIITNDNYQRRKQKNLFSMYAQVVGFALEIFYLLLTFCLRLIGRKFSIIHSREYIDAFYISQFCLTSTVQILVSSDLRLKLLVLAKQLLRLEK